VRASRRKRSELEHGIVFIEDELDAVQAAVRDVAGLEYFTVSMFDVLLPGGTTPHAVTSVDPLHEAVYSDVFR
jgi:hypothetical protein